MSISATSGLRIYAVSSRHRSLSQYRRRAHRIHYCHITVVRLVYLNGVSFDPNDDLFIAEVEIASEAVWRWLKEAGRVVVQGMIAMPEGMQEVRTLMPSVPYKLPLLCVAPGIVPTSGDSVLVTATEEGRGAWEYRVGWCGHIHFLRVSSLLLRKVPSRMWGVPPPPRLAGRLNVPQVGTGQSPFFFFCLIGNTL